VSGTNCIAPGTTAQDDHGHGNHVGRDARGAQHAHGRAWGGAGHEAQRGQGVGRQGTGALSEIVYGIDWVTANAASLNIKVVNMSVKRGGRKRRQLRADDR
jgi:subtilisin family serine protease